MVCFKVVLAALFCFGSFAGDIRLLGCVGYLFVSLVNFACVCLVIYVLLYVLIRTIGWVCTLGIRASCCRLGCWVCSFVLHCWFLGFCGVAVGCFYWLLWFGVLLACVLFVVFGMLWSWVLFCVCCFDCCCVACLLVWFV